jgi:hypothetical protein
MFGAFLPEPVEDPPRGMALFARRRLIGFQNLVDPFFNRLDFGLGSDRRFARRRYGAGDRTIRRCTPNFLATPHTVPTPC